jgi:general stress protein 26
MADTRTTESAAEFSDLVDGIRVAMLTTVDTTGALQARPLTVQRVDEEGAVWFLVDAGAEWITDRMPSVNVAFSNGTTWVSATGSARLVLDPGVIADLGDPVSDAWFEEGSTPAALRVDVGRADYWDGPGKLSMLLHLGKAAVTGSQPDTGERGVIEP